MPQLERPGCGRRRRQSHHLWQRRSRLHHGPASQCARDPRGGARRHRAPEARAPAHPVKTIEPTPEFVKRGRMFTLAGPELVLLFSSAE